MNVTECSGTVGSRPSWMSEDQWATDGPCPCVLPPGHDGQHRCDHTAPDVETLWAIAVPRPNGRAGETFIPAASREHAEGMAKRWKEPARVAPWPHGTDMHAALMRGLTRVLGGEGTPRD